MFALRHKIYLGGNNLNYNMLNINQRHIKFQGGQVKESVIEPRGNKQLPGELVEDKCFFFGPHSPSRQWQF